MKSDRHCQAAVFAANFAPQPIRDFGDFAMDASGAAC